MKLSHSLAKAFLLGTLLTCSAVAAHALETETLGGTTLIQSTVGGIVIGLDEGRYGSGDGLVDRIFFFQTDQQVENLFFYGTAELHYYGSGLMIRELGKQQAWHFQVEGRALPTKNAGSNRGLLVLGSELISADDSAENLSLSQVQSFLASRAGELGQEPVAFKNFPGPFHDDTGEPCLGSSDPFCTSAGDGGGGSSGSCGTAVVSCSKSCTDGSQCSISCASGKKAECECAIDDPADTFASCNCESC